MSYRIAHVHLLGLIKWNKKNKKNKVCREAVVAERKSSVLFIWFENDNNHKCRRYEKNLTQVWTEVDPFKIKLQVSLIVFVFVCVFLRGGHMHMNKRK